MELQNGRYAIQGVSLEHIAEKFGTPLYVYNADKIAQQVAKLTNAFAALPLKLKYAMKAASNINILKLMKKLGVGIDAVSINEVKLAMLAGYPATEILFTPNSVSFNEIKEAVELGVQINIDNIGVLEHFGHEYGNTVPCCLRLNPHITAGGNTKIQTGHVDSKFGISILQLRHVLRVVNTNHIKINGLHVHTGSDFLDAEVFLRGASLVFEAAHEFQGLEFLDFGSGFKVAYRDGDLVTNVDELGAKMAVAYEAFVADYGSRPQIWFEPGKYLVSESGLLLTKVGVTKTTTSTQFAGVDSGLNHLLRPMMYDAYHDIVNISNPNGIKRLYSVVGYICETDTFGNDRKLNEVREGDLLALKNAGAYGFSMASNYNSRLRPAEVMIQDGKPRLIRHRETFDDLLRSQVIDEEADV